MHLCMPSRHISRLAETRIIMGSLMTCFFQNFHRQNPAATQGRCSIYPAIHDLLLNLSLPNEGPTFHGPPGGQGMPGGPGGQGMPGGPIMS